MFSDQRLSGMYPGEQIGGIETVQDSAKHDCRAVVAYAF